MEQAQDEIEAAGISVLLVSDGSTVVRDPATDAIATLATAPRFRAPGLAGAGGDRARPSSRGSGRSSTRPRSSANPLTDRSVPTLLLVREDDSARLASGDLVRALAVAAVVLLLVGIPLAVGLGRSVSGPLRRLALASGTVAAGPSPRAAADLRTT